MGETKQQPSHKSWFKNLFTPSSHVLRTEKLKRAVEERTAALEQANRKLVFQNNERGKRAAELIIANEELAFQSEEKGKRAAELVIANHELAFQNIEKEKRAAELSVANIELLFQNEEKGKRASELIIANKELAFQNEEKEKRAAELSIANTELVFQSEEKGKRAAELIIANTELHFQNEEKEKRAAELIIINTELEAFSYVSSHDLQEPLRKIMLFSKWILDKESENLSVTGRDYFNRIQLSAERMQQLIEDLLSFSSLNTTDRKFEDVNINTIVEEVKAELKETIEEKKAIIEITEFCHAHIIPFQFHQVMHNLIGNALKFSRAGHAPHIIIRSHVVKGLIANEARLLPEKEYCHIAVSDNGIGFEDQNKDQIFEVFKRLHSRKEYAGTGIGLAIVKKVIDNHHGIIYASGKVNEGTTFHIYIPVTQ